MTEQLITLTSPEEISVPSGSITPIAMVLQCPAPPWLEVTDRSIRFVARRWCEVLLTVVWDPSNTDGTRFCHTTIPDHHPLHSEAVAADVLARISNGRQLLRGNTIFNPGGPEALALEVWQDSGRPVTIKEARLELRSLSQL